MTATWTTAKIEDGWLYEELTGDDAWDGYRVTPLPGTLPAPATAVPAPAHARPLVLPAGCIPGCDRHEPHEGWECLFLATTTEYAT